MNTPPVIRWFRVRLAALRSQPILTAVILMLVFGIAVADAILIVYLKDQATAFGERETKNLSYALAEQTQKALQSAQLITSVIAERIESRAPLSIDEFETTAGGSYVSDVLRGPLTGFGHLDNITIASARGKLVARAASGLPPALDLSDREYLDGARGAPQSVLFISRPTKSRITGEWSLFLSKRVNSPTGQFLGVVTGVVELATLERLYSKITLGKHGSIWLARQDGTVLVRYPRIENAIGRTIKEPGPLGQLFYSGQSGVVRHMSPTDGRERIAALAGVHGYPLAITVTAALEDVLVEWQRQAITLVITGIAASVALSLLALILANATEQLAGTRSQLLVSREREEAQARFIAAISNMRQGLAMFDGAGNLIVCNQQYADLYQLPPEVLRPGTPREVLHRHRVAKRTGRRRQTVTGPGQFSNELEDGRIIAIAEQPLNGGGFVSTHEDVTEQHRAEEKMLRLARHDPLTDLPNRMVFMEALRGRVERAVGPERVAVHYLDLDGFKVVNDTLGHTAGDALLKKVASRLAKAVRATDMLSRLGGDEFAILQSVSSMEEAQGLASRINDLLSRPFDLAGQSIRIGSSIGISLSVDHGSNPDVLVQNADLALYAAKAAGRSTFKFFHQEMAEAVRDRLQLERELREALKQKQLELFYQPQVRLETMELVGFEALLRWRHPERGLLGPSEFISLAEETGLIVEIGEWAIKQACLEAAGWSNELRVAVNLSVVQLRSENLRPRVKEALAASGLYAERLELEVTESVMLNDTEANVTALLSLRELGVKISMDDFGTGFSSLSGLRIFPFDKLKIDRTFVSELTTREDCAAIVRSVVDLANSLGMSTTAEGIETAEQLVQAKVLGCQEGQGYLFGAPVPASSVGEFVRDRFVA